MCVILPRRHPVFKREDPPHVSTHARASAAKRLRSNGQPGSIREGKAAYRRNGKAVDLRYRGKLGAFSIHPRESMRYCGRDVVSLGLQSEKAFSYNKRTMDWAMGPF